MSNKIKSPVVGTINVRIAWKTAMGMAICLQKNRVFLSHGGNK